MSKNREVELRFQLDSEDAKTLTTIIEAGDSISTEHQDDLYFDTPERDWSRKDPIARWLRVRHTSTGEQITHKEFTFSSLGETTDCVETEMYVAPIGSARQLLEVLGLEPLIRVRKTRLSATVRNVRVALDIVEDLGTFAEFEVYAGDRAYAFTMNDLYAFVRELGINFFEADDRGYPYALLRKSDQDGSGVRGN